MSSSSACVFYWLSWIVSLHSFIAYYFSVVENVTLEATFGALVSVSFFSMIFGNSYSLFKYSSVDFSMMFLMLFGMSA